jgi:6-pyruvoyltetrahydropterin/6-carboxytetrahydropterin synthase
MLRVTKIFHFEMAHAIHGYAEACKNIHGHSYELHVTVVSVNDANDYIPAPGFVIDFKKIKKLVDTTVTEIFDHKLILSRNFLQQYPSFSSQENLVTWEAEPSAENMLLFLKQTLCKKFPAEIKLAHLKLYETKDSYAEWINDNTFNQY